MWAIASKRNPSIHLFIQMIGVVEILAGVAPGDVDFAGSQVEDHGVDGFFAVEWVGAIYGVIAD